MREQRLGEEVELLDVHAELAGAGAEQVALDADDVADVEQLVELEFALGDVILAHVDLEALAVLHQVQRIRPCPCGGRSECGRRHERVTPVLQLFGGLRVVVRANLRNGVGEIEAVAVGLVPERLDLANAREALFQ